MTTRREDSSDVAPDDRARVRTSRRVRVTPFAVVVVLVLLPLTVTLLSLIGTHWHASSDNALEVLRIRDVGGRHTPLTGVASRFGWDHPGPLLFWLLAPFHVVAGDTGVLVGAGAINGASLVAALVLARRRGGLPLVVVVAIGVLVLYRALGPSLLIDPWNPWVTVLPFFVYVLLAWSLAERDLAALPWLIGVGTFVVQTHVGYTPLVAGIGVVAVVLAAVSTREPVEHARRWLAVAAVVAAALWLAPVIQQLTGHPGNLTAILDSFRRPPEPTQGFTSGFGIMGKEIGIPGAWLTGNDAGPLGAAAVGTASTIPALCVLALACGLGVAAWRRGGSSAARFVVLTVAGAAVGVMAGARIIGFPADYLVRWWWALGALLWCAIAWSAWSAWTARRGARSRRWIAGIAGATLAALTITIVFSAVAVRVPGRQFSVAIGALAPATASHLTRGLPYRFSWVDSSDLGAVGYGLYLDLAERGFDVKVPPAFVQSFGTRHTASPAAAGPTVTVVTGDDLDLGWRPPAGAERIAQFDPLGAAARAQAHAITERIRADIKPHPSLTPALVDAPYGRTELAAAGVDPGSIATLHRLRGPGIPYVVYLIGAPS